MKNTIYTMFLTKENKTRINELKKDRSFIINTSLKQQQHKNLYLSGDKINGTIETNTMYSIE